MRAPAQAPVGLGFDAACDAIELLADDRLYDLYRVWMHALREHIALLENRYLPDDDQLGEFLCAAIINCNRLDDALETAVQFIRLCGECDLELTRTADGVRLSFDNRHEMKGPVAFIWDFLTICFFQKLFSWLTGAAIPVDVQFRHPELLDRALLTPILQPRSVTFDASENAMAFDDVMLARPIVRTYKELRDIQAKSPIELLSLAPRSLSKQLEEIFLRALRENHTVPSVDKLADSLCCSGPTLRRHLARENTSFQDVLSRCRKNVAIEMLGDHHLALDDISERLGFSNASAFSRAFKVWTGMAPSAFRKTVIGWPDVDKRAGYGADAVNAN